MQRLACRTYDSVPHYSFTPVLVLKLILYLGAYFCQVMCQTGAKCIGSLPMEPLK